MDERVDVVVVGGGVAGLTAGALSAQAGRRVAVLDGRRPGGRAATDVRGVYRFNQGAHALSRAGAGRRVLGRLGITPRGAAPMVKGRAGSAGWAARAAPGRAGRPGPHGAAQPAVEGPDREPPGPLGTV
jgi:glycine/D-amino acid oxidase-like deaminating enzyme